MVGTSEQPDGREPARDAGPQDHRTVERAPFEKLIVSGSIVVDVKQGDTQRIEVSGPATMLDDLQIISIDGRAIIGWREGAGWSYNPGHGVDIAITLPRLVEIATSHAATVIVAQMEAEDVQIFANDAGRVHVEDVRAGSAKIIKSGSGKLEIGALVSHRDIMVSKEGAGSLSIDGIEGPSLRGVIDGAGSSRFSGSVGEGQLIKKGAGRADLSNLAGAIQHG
ncbi:DUF2807 domain-containing protein [Sphingomicrobium sp. XHP0239]|uniref:GIN domain-containing protein n=1 Tax=Sphingomicrobium maritimum TaxID=3133972 RepID=UPI0031CC8A17